MAYDPPSIIAISVVLPLLAVGAVILRFLVRLRWQPTYIGVDDWLILGALVFLLADGANLIVATVLGAQGWESPGDPPPEHEVVEKKSDYAQVIIEKPLYAMMKLSVLFFFRRIFLVQKSFRLYNNIMIGLIIAWGTAFFFAEVFACGTNPESQWDPNAGSGSCVDLTWLNLVFSITDVIGDILVVTMPFPCIRKLQMSNREKFGIAFIFMLGTLSTIASILRLAFISMAFTSNFGVLGDSHNSGTPPSVWSTIEGAVGVLAACLPPLGPLIRKSANPVRSLKERLSGTKDSGATVADAATIENTFHREKFQSQRESEGGSRKPSKGESTRSMV